jgi:hypothetical protein
LVKNLQYRNDLWIGERVSNDSTVAGWLDQALRPQSGKLLRNIRLTEIQRDLQFTDAFLTFDKLTKQQ